MSRNDSHMFVTGGMWTLADGMEGLGCGLAFVPGVIAMGQYVVLNTVSVLCLLVEAMNCNY